MLEVTDALSSYAAKFSLEALMDFVVRPGRRWLQTVSTPVLPAPTSSPHPPRRPQSDESGVAPSGAILLEWLRERCCGGTLHATVAAAGGVTLSGVHMAAGDLPVALR